MCCGPWGLRVRHDLATEQQQYLEKYKTAANIQGWHQVKRQKELLIAGGEEVGDGRAKGLSAIGGGEQAATSLMPDVGVMPVSFF